MGYGDVEVYNNFERIFCAIIMIFGVMIFSIANGQLASIIQNYDSSNATHQEKLVTLNKIYKDYKLPLELFINIKKSVGYENQKNIHDIQKFIDDLPHKLKTEISLYVYEQRYQTIHFFQNKHVSFILWMCPLLRPMLFQENQYIFHENESINEIFFLINGRAAFVLPRYKNTPFVNIDIGNQFGEIDIIGSAQLQSIPSEDWYRLRANLTR